MPHNKEKHSPTEAYWRVPGTRGLIRVAQPEDNILLGQYHNAIDHVLGRKSEVEKVIRESETEWYGKDGALHSIYDFEGMTVTGISNKAGLGEIGEMGPRAIVNYTQRTDLRGFREYFSNLAEQYNRPHLRRRISDMTEDQLYDFVKKVNPEELRRYLLKNEPDTVRQYPLITDPEKLKELYEAGAISGRPVKYQGRQKR
jgi:hypothetical protein